MEGIQHGRAAMVTHSGLQFPPGHSLGKWWSVVAISGFGAVIMHEALLSQWGDVFAIIGGAVAALAFVYGVGRWWWNWLTGATIRRGLQTSAFDNPHARFFVDPNRPIELDGIGFSIRNITRDQISIHYKVQQCTVVVEGVASPLIAPFEGDISPGITTNFLRDLIVTNRTDFSFSVNVEYRLEYRKLNSRRFRRDHAGAYRFDVVATKATGELKATDAPFSVP